MRGRQPCEPWIPEQGLDGIGGGGGTIDEHGALQNSTPVLFLATGFQHRHAREISTVAASGVAVGLMLRPMAFQLSTSERHERGLWSHWAGRQAANRYEE